MQSQIETVRMPSKDPVHFTPAAFVHNASHADSSKSCLRLACKPSLEQTTCHFCSRASFLLRPARWQFLRGVSSQHWFLATLTGVRKRCLFAVDFHNFKLQNLLMLWHLIFHKPLSLSQTGTPKKKFRLPSVCRSPVKQKLFISKFAFVCFVLKGFVWVSVRGFR